MGFKRIDATTVQDEDGAKYYLPDAQDPQDVPDPDPVQVETAYLNAKDDPKGNQDPEVIDRLAPILKWANKPTSEIDMGEPDPSVNTDLGEMPPMSADPAMPGAPQAPVPGEPVGPQATAVAHQAMPPTKAQQAQSAADARGAMIRNNLPGYAAQGGTIDSPEDLSMMAAGQADLDAKAAVDEQKAKEIAAKAAADGEIEKTKAAAATADEIAKNADRVYGAAQRDYKEWAGRMKKASEAVVDPNRAFNNMSGFSRAMWALSFIGAGMQGGAQVLATEKMLENILKEDVNAQKETIDNKRESLAAEGSGLREDVAIAKDQLKDDKAAIMLRYDAVLKGLDAKKKAIGDAAFEQAGLSKVYAGIQHTMAKTMEDGYKTRMEQAKAQVEEFNKVKLANLGHYHKTVEEKQSKDLALRNELAVEQEKAKTEKAKQITDLPTGTGLGLNAMDPKTGKKVDVVHLVANPEQRQKAGAILAAANEEASLLKEVESDIKDMSPTDLARGGGPEFAAKATQLILERAKRYNGSRLSDADVMIAAKNEFGMDVVVSDGIVSKLKGILMSPGAFKEHVEAAIATHRRNLASETVGQLAPYIESQDARNLIISYTPQDVRIPAPSSGERDIDTMVGQAADHPVTRRAPGSKGPAEPDAAGLKGTGAIIDDNEVQAFDRMKKIGRGKPDGLRVLPAKDEAAVEKFAADLKALHERGQDTEDNINFLKNEGYLGNKIGAQAKREISIEAFKALEEYRAKESTRADIKKVTGAKSAGIRK